jgi:hypothetical protein
MKPDTIKDVLGANPDFFTISRFRMEKMLRQLTRHRSHAVAATLRAIMEAQSQPEAEADDEGQVKP